MTKQSQCVVPAIPISRILPDSLEAEAGRSLSSGSSANCQPESVFAYLRLGILNNCDTLLLHAALHGTQQSSEAISASALIKCGLGPVIRAHLC